MDTKKGCKGRQGAADTASSAAGSQANDHDISRVGQDDEHSQERQGGRSAEQPKPKLTDSEDTESADPVILEDVPWIPKGTGGYKVVENMIEKKAERLAAKMKKSKEEGAAAS
jgi:hypothetical protein